jgi:hypothetical protein
MPILDFTITFSTHAVRVKKYADGIIRCFKFTKSRCDIERFHCEYEAGEYLFIPLNSELLFEEMINK